MSHWKLPLPKAPQRPVQCEFPVALLSGFAAYTTFRLPLHKTWIQAHLERLKHDACFLGLDWAYTNEALYEQIISIPPKDEPVIRLTAYADVSHFTELFPPHLPCHLLLSTRQAPPLPKAPLNLKTVSYSRTFPAIKLTGIGEVIHLKRAAIQEGYQDILLTNHNEYITEASTANFFAIDSYGAIHTADPERDGCLPGITRRQILELIKQHDFTLNPEPLKKSQVQNYSGAFITNAVQGLVPVQKIDQYALPWPSETQFMFKKLQKAWS